MKNLKNIFIIFLLFIFAINCNNKKEEVNKYEKVIKIALSSDPGFDNFDNILTGNTLIQANAMVYEGLVKYGDKGKIEPALAKSWEISNNGKRYIFHIREGVTFTDGTPLNAKVVKFSFDRWVHNPKLKSISIAKYLENIEIIDDMTVAFNFKESYYPMLTEFSYPRPVRIMSLNSVSPAGDPNGKFVKSIGTGPWVIESYKKDQKAVLIKNSNYWGEVPIVDKIEFIVLPDPQTRVYAMQNGEIDITGGPMSIVSIDSLELIAKNKEIEVKTFPSTMSYFTIFNFRNEKLKDINVRKAMNMLLDTKVIVDNIMNGIGKPSKALFQENVPYTTNQNSKWYDFNMEEAKKLLYESGYKLNSEGILEKNGEKLSFKFVFSDNEYPEWKVMSEYIQSQFSKVGIELKLENRELNAYYDSLWKDKDYDLIMYRTYSDSWNPHGFLLSLFTGTKDDLAIAWDDKELTRIIEDVVTQNDKEIIQKGYDKIYEKMYKEALFIPVYYPEEIFLVNKKLKNVEPGFDSYVPFIWNKIDIR